MYIIVIFFVAMFPFPLIGWLDRNQRWEVPMLHMHVNTMLPLPNYIVFESSRGCGARLQVILVQSRHGCCEDDHSHATQRRQALWSHDYYTIGVGKWYVSQLVVIIINALPFSGGADDLIGAAFAAKWQRVGSDARAGTPDVRSLVEPGGHAPSPSIVIFFLLNTLENSIA